MDDPLNETPQGPPDSPSETPESVARELPPEWTSVDPAAGNDAEAASARRRFRRHMLTLLALAVAAFALTALILVRLESPLGVRATGPGDVVRAQLVALDRGQLREAYDLFSAHYRQQVSFDAWHELVATHWRMFHTREMHAGEPQGWGGRVELEVHLRAADGSAYRAWFTLVRVEGRWWIDDVRWGEEPDVRDRMRA